MIKNKPEPPTIRERARCQRIVLMGRFDFKALVTSSSLSPKGTRTKNTSTQRAIVSLLVIGVVLPCSLSERVTYPSRQGFVLAGVRSFLKQFAIIGINAHMNDHALRVSLW